MFNESMWLERVASDAVVTDKESSTTALLVLFFIKLIKKMVMKSFQ